MPNLQETPMVEHDSTQSVMQGLQTNATGIIFFPATKFFPMQVSIFPIFYRWPLRLAYATSTRKYYSSTSSFSFFLKLILRKNLHIIVLVSRPVYKHAKNENGWKILISLPKIERRRSPNYKLFFATEN